MSAQTPAENGWEDPVPFPQIHLPPFPLETLPGELRDFVEAVSTSTQTPPDLAAMLGLTVCSFCLSDKFPIVPREDWRLPLNVFSVVLLESGSRKSPVFREFMSPIRSIERELIESAKPAIAMAYASHENDKSELRRLQANSKSGPKVNRKQLDDLAAKIHQCDLPVEPRLLIDNPSPEYVEQVLHAQRRPMAVLSDEGGVMDILAGGRYSAKRGANVDIILKGYDGDPFTSGRIIRGETRIERALLTWGSTLQPSVMEKLRDEDDALTTRGFFARFMIVCPAGNVGYRDVDPPVIPKELRNKFDVLVQGLWQLANGGEIQLSPEAHVVRHQWASEVEEMFRDDRELARMAEWGGKLVGNTMKLAGVLHAIQHLGESVNRPVDAQTMERAIEIGRYLIPHATHFFQGTQARFADARRAWQYIVKLDRPRFSLRDLHRASGSRFGSAESLREILDQLEDLGYIREVPQVATGRVGRRPSTEYDVNPKAKSVADCVNSVLSEAG